MKKLNVLKKVAIVCLVSLMSLGMNMGQTFAVDGEKPIVPDPNGPVIGETEPEQNTNGTQDIVGNNQPQDDIFAKYDRGDVEALNKIITDLGLTQYAQNDPKNWGGFYSMEL